MFGAINTSLIGLGASNPLGLILGIGITVVLVIIGGLLVRAARRWYRDTEIYSSESCGFSLQELREMRADGRISEEEYDAARSIILGTAGSTAAGAGEVSEQRSVKRHDG